MKALRIYDNISELLGDEKKRFFSNGYKLVNHEIQDFYFNEENREGMGEVKIKYNEAFAQKGNSSLKAHFTTLDLLVLANYTCEKIIESQFICSFEDCWFNRIRISTLGSSTDLNENILKFKVNVNDIEICEEGYRVDFVTIASNLKIECSAYINGELSENPKSINIDEKVLLQDTSIGKRLTMAIRKIEETYINPSAQYIVSKIRVKNNTNEYYDIFDMFICMSQQVQALFYKYDNLDREDTNNLWMREIVFENSKRFKIDKSFYQIVSLSKTNILNRKEKGLWRLGNLSVSIIDFQELTVRTKVAHVLPKNKEVVVNE